MSYQIRLLFETEGCEDDRTMPTVVEAVDEYTEDVWGGIPDFYTDKLSKTTRELVVEIDADAVRALLATKVVSGRVSPLPPQEEENE